MPVQLQSACTVGGGHTCHIVCDIVCVQVLLHGWVQNDYGTQPETKAVVERYITSFYFAAATMTTVGYGDYHATTKWEKLAAIMSMIVGGYVFGTVVSTITELHRHRSYGDATAQQVSRRFPFNTVWLCTPELQWQPRGKRRILQGVVPTGNRRACGRSWGRSTRCCGRTRSPEHCLSRSEAFLL
jgi:hypothetical protein